MSLDLSLFASVLDPRDLPSAVVAALSVTWPPVDLALSFLAFSLSALSLLAPDGTLLAVVTGALALVALAVVARFRWTVVMIGAGPSTI